MEIRATARVDSKGNVWIYFDQLSVRLKVTPSYFRKHSEKLVNDREEMLKKLNLNEKPEAST